MLLLLDANISPKTAEFLRRRFSFDIISLIESKMAQLNDRQVVAFAKVESRVIITMDLDFGELYHESDPVFGVIIIRLRDQRSKFVNDILESFFINPISQKIFRLRPHSLVVLDETSIRIN